MIYSVRTKAKALEVEYNIDHRYRIVDLDRKTGASHIGIQLIINWTVHRYINTGYGRHRNQRKYF